MTISEDVQSGQFQIIDSRKALRANLIERRDVSADSGVAGGYLFTGQMYNELVKAEGKASVMRQICRTLPPINADEIPVPTLESLLTDAEWVSELGIATMDATTPFGQRVLHPHQIKKSVKVSNRLMQRSAFAEQWIIEAMGDSIAVPQEKAFIQGAGAGEAQGLLNADGLPTFTTALSTAVNTHELREWIFSLPARFLRNATILTSTGLLKHLGLQVDGDGAPIFPEFKGKIENIPVALTDGMPTCYNAGALLASTIVAVIGDFSYYWIQDNAAIRVDRLSELYAATNQTGLNAIQETDGMAVVSAAFYALKTHA